MVDVGCLPSSRPYAGSSQCIILLTITFCFDLKFGRKSTTKFNETTSFNLIQAMILIYDFSQIFCLYSLVGWLVGSLLRSYIRTFVRSFIFFFFIYNGYHKHISQNTKSFYPPAKEHQIKPPGGRNHSFLHSFVYFFIFRQQVYQTVYQEPL